MPRYNAYTGEREARFTLKHPEVVRMFRGGIVADTPVEAVQAFFTRLILCGYVPEPLDQAEWMGWFVVDEEGRTGNVIAWTHEEWAQIRAWLAEWTGRAG